MHAQLWLFALVLAIWGHLTCTDAGKLDQEDRNALGKLNQKGRDELGELLASLKPGKKMGAFEAMETLEGVRFFFLNYPNDPNLRTLSYRRDYIRMLLQYTRVAGGRPIECGEAFGIIESLHEDYISLARLMKYQAMLQALRCPEQYRDWERAHNGDDDVVIQVNCRQPAAVGWSEEEIGKQRKELSHLRRLFFNLKRSDYESDRDALINIAEIIIQLEDANMYRDGKLVNECKMVVMESREIFNKCRLECSAKSNGCFGDCVSGQKKPEMEKCLTDYEKYDFNSIDHLFGSDSEDESDSDSDPDSDSDDEE